jgi:uncharacterized circularly permuted ATP-grasp superfamily protein
MPDNLRLHNEHMENEQYTQLLYNINQYLGKDKFDRLIQLAEKQLRTRSVQYLLGGGATSYFPTPQDEQFVSVDWIPRIINKDQFLYLEKGIIQRAVAFNKFLRAFYKGEDSVVPKQIIASSQFYTKENIKLTFPHDVFVHIYGIDLVSDKKGDYLVLEDNIGFPGGIGYVQEIRKIAKVIMPELFNRYQIADVESFSNDIYRSLASISPEKKKHPIIIYLQRGPGAADRLEHRLLANDTSIILADPEDITFSTSGDIYLKLHNGNRIKVDVIYTRLSTRFRETNQKLSEALKKGKVTVVTHPGNLLPGDKGIFPFVPDMIRHYLNEEPILKQPSTYWLGEQKNLHWALQNISKIVIKSRWGLGGKEVLIGSEAEYKKIEKWKSIIRASPQSFVAQDLVEFTSTIKWDRTTKQFSSVHADLRMFAFIGYNNHVSVMKGGLSRFAPLGTQKVNVSLGGGFKDIWVEEGSDNDI